MLNFLGVFFRGHVCFSWEQHPIPTSQSISFSFSQTNPTNQPTCHVIFDQFTNMPWQVTKKRPFELIQKSQIPAIPIFPHNPRRGRPTRRPVSTQVERPSDRAIQLRLSFNPPHVHAGVLENFVTRVWWGNLLSSDPPLIGSLIMGCI